MLWRILNAWDGTLPSDVLVCFANTGREMPATLDFVASCQAHWGVSVEWLEYRRDPDTGRTWTETVNHNNASRNGEPFRALLAGKKMLPNPLLRYCTIELKIRAVGKWIVEEYGWEKWKSIVGLRADEMHRVVKMAKRNAQRKERFTSHAPLAKARLTKADVTAFWNAQPFDLALTGPWEGNCDLCFLKSSAARRRMAADYPERAAEWADDESVFCGKGTLSTDAARYRKDGLGYREIIEYVSRNPRLPGVDRDPMHVFDPFADCEGGCGL